MRYLLPLLPILLLSGCATPATTGNYREYNTPITIRDNSGHVVLVVPVRVEAMSENTQTTDQTATPVTDLQVQLPKIIDAAKSALDSLIGIDPEAVLPKSLTP